MKKSKRIISLLLSVLMIVTTIPLMTVNSFAVGGKSGDFKYEFVADNSIGIKSYTGSAENLVIPSEIDGYPVTYIMVCAFYQCTSLKTVTIPNSVVFIDCNAFTDCTSLTSITLPEGLTEISDAAFEGCSSLTNIIIPDSVTNIGESAFSDCSSLESVTLPKHITSLKNFTFDGCTSLTNIIIPDGVTSIGFAAFFGCRSLTSITIPDSVTSIGDMAFRYCRSLTGKIEIPNGVTSIDVNMFEGCSSLLNITIPASVKTINGVTSNSLDVCTNLTSIDVAEDNLYYSSIDGVLYNKEKTVLIRCPANKSGDVFSIPNGVENVGDCAFLGCKFNTVFIPESVTAIGEGAFFDCMSLKSVTIPQTVSEIKFASFGRYYDEIKDEGGLIQGFTIYGISGSEAEKYAKDTEVKFIDIANISFPDVPANEWYSTAIAFNVNKGYLKGYENGYFGPADNIQRQDFVVLLSRIAGADLSAYEGQNGGFADVPTDTYFSAAVAWAKDNNILSGYENGLFGVGDPITREQVCKIFYNYYTEYCDKGVGSSNSPETVCGWYPDGDTVSDWAVRYVAWAAENHIVGGNGTLNPAGNANRAEMAQIIMNMSNNNIL